MSEHIILHGPAACVQSIGLLKLRVLTQLKKSNGGLPGTKSAIRSLAIILIEEIVFSVSVLIFLRTSLVSSVHCQSHTTEGSVKSMDMTKMFDKPVSISIKAEKITMSDVAYDQESRSAEIFSPYLGSIL